ALFRNVSGAFASRKLARGTVQHLVVAPLRTLLDMVRLRASFRFLAGCFALSLLSACHVAARTANAADAPAMPCSEGIPDLFKRVSPAVVMITGQSINPYRLQGRVTRVLGSGFVIDANGLILTNSHVVFGLQSLTVTLDDGAIVPAKLVGADPIFDLA